MISDMDGTHDCVGAGITPEAVLHGHGLRVTSLRMSVVSAFLAAGGALSADDLMARVGFGSLSSIYRALEAMEAAGVLARCPVSGGVRRFCLAPGKSSGHNHFECLGCGRVTHFEMDLPEGCMDRALGKGFRVASASIHLSGTCRECARRAKG